MRSIKFAIALTALGLMAGSASALTINDPAGQGEVALGPMSGGGLSGLAYVGGDQYLAVADSGGKLFNVTIAIDPATGLISGVPTLGGSVVLAGSVDLEGLEYDPTNNTVIVSDEVGPKVRRYQLDGTQVGPDFTLPAVYSDARPNLSLESVARAANGDVWIVNEEALFKAGGTNDGPEATATQGSAVRIANLTSGKQWAYITDPTRMNFTQFDASGVSSMLILPNGKVLILERELSLGFRNRIYEVDFTDATDVSTIASLDSNANNDLTDEPWTAVTKTLLWEKTFATNYEGMTLGPQLENGDYTLLLISDDDNGLPQNLYVLHLQGDVPEPISAAMLAPCLLLLIQRRR